jgi:hypothetical protein
MTAAKMKVKRCQERRAKNLEVINLEQNESFSGICKDGLGNDALP